MLHMKYNERIREIREDNSLTQQKIADLLHIGQRTYADYESGKTRIPIDNLLILAFLLSLKLFFYLFYHSQHILILLIFERNFHQPYLFLH